MRIKNNLLFVFIVLLSLQSNLFPWGDKGHKLINKKAIEILPYEMNDFKIWIDFITEYSVDADERKSSIKDEYPKHFIDIDYYKEFNSGEMIYDKEFLISKYGNETVVKMGLLPWAIKDTYNNLKDAFKNKNKEKAMQMIADLGHYIADAHQPMHTVMNYDGQLTNQKGLHSRYEIKMIDEYLLDLENSIRIFSPTKIENPQKCFASIIEASNSFSPIIFDADVFAARESDNEHNNLYYKLLWFRTKAMTIDRFENAIYNLSSLIYSAWIEAEKPKFSEFK
ncbi:MAG: hypothetical protein STSR0008_17210 [Ignavibacterium sp.]